MRTDQVKILVVDDVNAMRNQIKSLLKSFGFSKITVCEDGAQALTWLQVEEFHLVLADWHMGAVSGIDILSHLRKTPEHAQSGFIMVTAEGTRERVVEAIQSGVDDYLIKPLTIGQIQEKVFGVLLRRGLL